VCVNANVCVRVCGSIRTCVCACDICHTCENVARCSSSMCWFTRGRNFPKATSTIHEFWAQTRVLRRAFLVDGTGLNFANALCVRTCTHTRTYTCACTRTCTHFSQAVDDFDWTVRTLFSRTLSPLPLSWGGESGLYSRKSRVCSGGWLVLHVYFCGSHFAEITPGCGSLR
jgi:hypothetical protein